MRALLLPFVSLVSASMLQAALIIDIEGVPGEGTTIWTFSGSYQTGNFNVLNNSASVSGAQQRNVLVNMFQHSLGDMSGEWISNANYNAVAIAATTSSATITSGSTVRTLNGLFLDSNGSEVSNPGRDNLAWFATGAFSPNTFLEFAGSLELPADITTFGEGTTAIVSVGDSFSVSSSSEITPLSLSFTAIPEPSVLSCSFAFALLLVTRRR